MDRTMIYLCDCGNYKHRAGAVFCSLCGKRIDLQRDDDLADEIEALLKQWTAEKEGGIHANFDGFIEETFSNAVRGGVAF